MLYERAVVGGMAAITDQIDNYPGFAEGIAGMKLSSELQGQAERFGAEIEYGEASSLKRVDDYIEIIVDGQPVHAKAVLLATGSVIASSAYRAKMNCTGVEYTTARHVTVRSIATKL